MPWMSIRASPRTPSKLLPLVCVNYLIFLSFISNWPSLETLVKVHHEAFPIVTFIGIVVLFMNWEICLWNTPVCVLFSCCIAKNITNEWAKGVLSGAEKLTEERVDEILNEFQKDFKEAKSWSIYPSAYTISKAALNAYSRIMARKYLTFYINCVCPGYVKTDMNYNASLLTVEEGAESTVRLAMLPDGGPSSQFFLEKEVSEYWLKMIYCYMWNENIVANKRLCLLLLTC